MGVNFAPVFEQLPDAPERWQVFFQKTFARVEENRPESVAVFWEELRKSLAGSEDTSGLQKVAAE